MERAHMHDQSSSAARHAKPRHAKGCRDVDPRLVRRMQAMVTHRTDEALGERFGISYNTWRKLMAGQPIRASLLSRLEARLESLEAQAAPHNA
jgi:hypothetical protein